MVPAYLIALIICLNILLSKFVIAKETNTDKKLALTMVQIVSILIMQKIGNNLFPQKETLFGIDWRIFIFTLGVALILGLINKNILFKSSVKK